MVRWFMILFWTVCFVGCHPKAPWYRPVKQLDFSRTKKVRVSRQDMTPYLQSQYVFQGGPGDQLLLTWWDADKLRNAILQIAADGRLSTPFSGRLQVRGLSLHQIESKIRVFMQKYYYRPQTTLRWYKIVSTRISVLGSVIRPGSFSRYSPVRLSSLLAMVGGLKRAVDPVQAQFAADLSRAFVKRGGKVITPDFAALLRGDTRQDIWILPGDTVFVPAQQRKEYILLGEVKRPARYLSLRRVHVFELIAAGGGRKQDASEEVLLVRGSLSKPKVYRLHLGEMMAGRQPNFYLSPGDM
ncbi:MAG: polysaccharide biosynthesis/export family protein, partial [Myxococcota bacterium]